MPYIAVEDRDRLMQPGQQPKTPGELNFIITLIIDQYWHENGANYQALNDIVGVLNLAGMEYYRRKGAYYEDRKMLENGDVYRRETQGIERQREEAPAPQEPLCEGPEGAEVSPESRPQKEA